MKLTVLGNSNRYLSPLGAGVSYLLTAGDARVVVDCANGTDRRLREALGSDPLSALVLPHFHEATLADVLPVLRFLPPGAPVYVPRGALPDLRDRLTRNGKAHARTLRYTEVSEGDEATVGPLRFRFARAHHGCAGIAFRAACDGASLAWVGDTGYLPGLRDIAAGANLLVAHTLMLDGEAEGDHATRNLSAGAAARLAQAAGVERLALAHVPFYEDAPRSLDEARAHFPREVFLLEETHTYPVGSAPTVP